MDLTNPLSKPVSTPVPAEPRANSPQQKKGGIRLLPPGNMYTLVESHHTFPITAFIVGALATVVFNSLFRALNDFIR